MSELLDILSFSPKDIKSCIILDTYNNGVLYGLDSTKYYNGTHLIENIKVYTDTYGKYLQHVIDSISIKVEQCNESGNVINGGVFAMDYVGKFSCDSNGLLSVLNGKSNLTGPYCCFPFKGYKKPDINSKDYYLVTIKYTPYSTFEDELYESIAGRIFDTELNPVSKTLIVSVENTYEKESVDCRYATEYINLSNDNYFYIGQSVACSREAILENTQPALKYFFKANNKLFQLDNQYYPVSCNLYSLRANSQLEESETVTALDYTKRAVEKAIEVNHAYAYVVMQPSGFSDTSYIYTLFLAGYRINHVYLVSKNNKKLIKDFSSVIEDYSLVEVNIAYTDFKELESKYENFYLIGEYERTSGGVYTSGWCNALFFDEQLSYNNFYDLFRADIGKIDQKANITNNFFALSNTSCRTLYIYRAAGGSIIKTERFVANAVLYNDVCYVYQGTMVSSAGYINSNELTGFLCLEECYGLYKFTYGENNTPIYVTFDSNTNPNDLVIDSVYLLNDDTNPYRCYIYKGLATSDDCGMSVSGNTFSDVYIIQKVEAKYCGGVHMFKFCGDTNEVIYIAKSQLIGKISSLSDTDIYHVFKIKGNPDISEEAGWIYWGERNVFSGAVEGNIELDNSGCSKCEILQNKIKIIDCDGNSQIAWWDFDGGEFAQEEFNPIEFNERNNNSFEIGKMYAFDNIRLKEKTCYYVEKAGISAICQDLDKNYVMLSSSQILGSADDCVECKRECYKITPCDSLTSYKIEGVGISTLEMYNGKTVRYTTDGINVVCGKIEKYRCIFEEFDSITIDKILEAFDDCVKCTPRVKIVIEEIKRRPVNPLEEVPTNKDI